MRRADLRVPRPAVVALLVLAVVLTSCRTVVTVAVDVTDDGSGDVTVTAELDPEAAAALGGPDRLVLDDVRESGWELGARDVTPAGGLSVSATRPFADAGELAAVLDEVGGPGTVSDAGVGVTDGFGSTTYTAAFDVAVSGDPASFADEALTGLLGGLPLGHTPDELAAQGVDQPGAGTLVVTLEVPGGGEDRAELDLTGGQPVEASLAAEATESDQVVRGLALVGALLLVAAVVSAILSLARTRRRRRTG